MPRSARNARASCGFCLSQCEDTLGFSVYDISLSPLKTREDMFLKNVSIKTPLGNAGSCKPRSCPILLPRFCRATVVLNLPEQVGAFDNCFRFSRLGDVPAAVREGSLFYILVLKHTVRSLTKQGRSFDLPQSPLDQIGEFFRFYPKPFNNLLCFY